MEKIDKIAKQQETLGKEILRYISNFKKDSASRKTKEYVEERLEKINKIWQEICHNHGAITELGCTEHNYTKQNYFDQLTECYNEAIELITEQQRKITQETTQHQTQELVHKSISNLVKEEKVLLKQMDELIDDIDIELETEILSNARSKQLQEKITKKWRDIANNYLQLEIEEEHLTLKTMYKKVEKKHEKTLLILSEKTEASQVATTTINKQCNIVLPQIKLPIFDGRYDEWNTFRDIFTKVVHENSTLNDIEKMQYLKTHIKGEASHIIQHLQITSSNYRTSWNILTDRYSNERRLTTQLINKILDFPAISTESTFKLKQLHDTTTECLEALNNLNIDTTTWGPMINILVSRKWDAETNRLYEQSLDEPHKVQPTEKLMKFLRIRFQSLETVRTTERKWVENGQTNNVVTSYTTNNNQNPCPCCKRSHALYTCSKFQAMTEKARVEFVKGRKICMNCLSHGNSIKCHSKLRCQKCNRFHHTLVHMDNFHQEYHQTNRNANPRITNQQQQNRQSSNIGRQNETVILATAMVRVPDVYGMDQVLRILIDPGSQSTFMTEEAAKTLALPRKRIEADVSGLGGGKPQVAKWMIEATIKPRFSSIFTLPSPCIILPRLTHSLPSRQLDVDQNTWKNELLADPTFAQPGPIDIILGAKEYGEIILEGLKKNCGGLLGQNTELGWILSGTIASRESTRLKINGLMTLTEGDQQLLTKFWELEEIQTEKQLSQNEQFVEEHYETNTTRNQDGTYTVRLPFNQHVEKLGQSKPRAVARLLQLEKRLAKDKELETSYKKFMKEYLSLNHMEVVNNDHASQTSRYYIPHQPVIKESSTTTKLRVVFDASSKTSTGLSLNDTMFAGPKLQQELSDIILRWRCHKIVITADIEKMYRQIKIHPDDQQFQTILWRFNPGDPLQEYRLTTVTYGTTSAPYLAIKTTQQLAKDEEATYPKASLIAKRDFYVDDLLTGTDTIEEAIELQTDLTKMFKSGGFTLRKWSSNSKTVLSVLDAEIRDECMYEVTGDHTKKSLGILWNPHDDTFKFKIKVEANPKHITKRHILSEVAKLFDPLGWLTPVIITAKILIQELWLQNLKWDDPVPKCTLAKWSTFRNELRYIEEITIPRWTNEFQLSKVEIHGFCDSSEKAYGAVIYIKVDTRITLLTSKSKVAPVKTKTSLPRLELCSAVLLAKLMQRTIHVRLNQETEVFAWTDSMITLSWIKGEPHKWKTFVANRVSEINNLVPKERWNHVRSEDNPADIISRGIEPSKLINHELWWQGPKWLQSPRHTYNLSPERPMVGLPEEEIKRCHTVMIKIKYTENELILRFSSLTRLLRVTAWCQRFVNNCKTESKLSPPLSVKELDKALYTIAIQEQIRHFHEEIKALKDKRPLPKTSTILNLNPFLDKNGVVRVGGRLENSQLPYNTKHPIILPYNCHLTKLVIQNAHDNTLHGGNQLTLAYTRNKFWIINGKRAVKGIITKCIRCVRFKAQAAEQIMGNLPEARISQSHPFQHTGVDYAGPFQIKTTKGRGYKAYKGYIAIFVCFATKAVHIEVVSDMTSETFLAAFKRFIARRGRCAHIYSDNGTNFVGASKILHQEVQQIKKDSGIENKLVSMGTQWHFNPPSAPHFGGLWEAGVKSMKYHLKRVIGETRLTFEEMTTLMHQIEASLNSRPLCPLSDDHNDLAILTPGHFLIGRPLVEPPDPIDTPINSSLNERWKLIQKIKKDVWKKWTSEYLHQLQQRNKWKHQQKNLAVGEVVLLKEQDINPSKWPLAIITQLHPGQDNSVRVVTVKKAEGSPIKRPIHKLIPLPKENDQSKQCHVRGKYSKLWKIVLTAILFMVTLQKSTAQRYEIYNPPPGLYIEHLGHAKIDRGTFRMELRFEKAKLTKDTREVKESIEQLDHLCEKAKELARNTQCTSLVQHLKDKQKQIEWIDLGIKSIIKKRMKRGLVGKILTSLFGVNDEVYVDIEKLEKNQQELIRTSNHQTKFMLQALTTFNDTEVRINNKLNQFQEKVKKALENIDNMSHWYKMVDENMLSIYLLSAYQTVSNYIDDVMDYQKRLLDVHYHRDHLFELITPSQVEEVIASTSQKLPSNIQIVPYPILKTGLNHSQEFIHVYGYFIITEVEDFMLLKTTPIPLKITKTAYWILDITNEPIAVNYDSQLYFQLSDMEFNSCVAIGNDIYVCSPSSIKSIEASPHCIIDEIFQRTDNTTCPVHMGTMQSIIWKQLATPNAWLFITGNRTRIAIICDGSREEVTLNNTGIIQISQNCVIKTNRNILVAKRFETTTVLSAAVTPVRLNLNLTDLVIEPTLKSNNGPQEEPVITASDTLGKLRDDEMKIQHELERNQWMSLQHHVSTSYVVMCVLLTVTAISVSTGCYLCLARRRPYNRRPRQPSKDHDQGIPLEALRVYGGSSGSMDPDLPERPECPN